MSVISLSLFPWTGSLGEVVCIKFYDRGAAGLIAQGAVGALSCPHKPKARCRNKTRAYQEETPKREMVLPLGPCFLADGQRAFRLRVGAPPNSPPTRRPFPTSGRKVPGQRDGGNKAWSRQGRVFAAGGVWPCFLESDTILKHQMVTEQP